MPEYRSAAKSFLVVDDHALIRSALTTLLKTSYSFALVDELSDGTRLLDQLKRSTYDLIILDLQMPDSETIELIGEVTLQYPDCRLLIYSMAPENLYAVRVLKAGARGFLSKQSSVEELERAIAIVLQGKTYISNDVAVMLSLQRFKIPATPFSILSSRELQILNMLLAGKTVTAISKDIALKHSTVGTHKAKLFKKLNVSNLLELKELAMLYQI